MTPSTLDDILHVLRHVVGEGAVAGVDESLLDPMARFAADVLAPLGRELDQTGCRLENGRVILPPAFKAAFERYAADGWLGLSIPEEHGGAGVGELAQAAVSEMVHAANIPFGMLAINARAASRAIIEHAEPWLKELVVPLLLSGRWGATIAMTEPVAGSDISLLKTTATPLESGRYAISGSKIFISFGDQSVTENIAHILLARVAGEEGLSLFLVPRLPIDTSGAVTGPAKVSVIGLEHKMGLAGSPTCALSFEGAEGFLLGERGKGLRNIFAMVNTMRLEVALQGVGLAAAASRTAFAYAAERVQGKDPAGNAVTIDQHLDVRRNLMRMRALTEGVRALVYRAASLVGSRDADHGALLALLLPVCKTASSEISIEVASLGIQVHGGYGYVRDYGAEQILRDARITTIYEGTSGIQAQDLVMRKLRRGNRNGYAMFRALIAEEVAAAAGHAEIAATREAVAGALAALDRATERIVAASEEDALAAATPYMWLAWHTAIGGMWLRMAAPGRAGTMAALAGKRALAAYYARQVLPAVAVYEAQVALGADAIPRVQDLAGA